MKIFHIRICWTLCFPMALPKKKSQKSMENCLTYRRSKQMSIDRSWWIDQSFQLAQSCQLRPPRVIGHNGSKRLAIFWILLYFFLKVVFGFIFICFLAKVIIKKIKISKTNTINVRIKQWIRVTNSNDKSLKLKIIS